MNLTKEQKEQFEEILEEVGSSLDITESEYNAAVQSYESVGRYLSKDDSDLAKYEPTILPQGSFLLGTVIRPICKDDDIDLDLVCQLKNKNFHWTQADVKNKVGDQLRKHKTLESLLDEEGRRCWTLKYREKSPNGGKYHMDILPAIISEGYGILLEKAFSNRSLEEIDSLSIRMTDTELLNYPSSIYVEEWPKTNPFGYASWFFQQAEIGLEKSFSLRESIKPVPKYQKEKLPLQRAVQILKRHRDMIFNGDEDKPISIIITTLAARAYRKESDVVGALFGIVNRMEDFVETKEDPVSGEFYKSIPNPVNLGENFADRWRGNSIKEDNFYKWLKKLKKDLAEFVENRGVNLQNSLSDSLGKGVISEAFTKIGVRKRMLTESGLNRFDSKIGISTSGVSFLKSHNFYGNAEE
ncbi:nucleotidyltransferase domain-containing protein [Algoriphagus winogradskyi]|uniref:Cyclic GMP-AMP synthase n=1 Tax=Algoriphagus winogradskyi TaxID=237017 RepID=A0ABY1PIC1_9BACT|nr:nucleotidyltransferase [Algoriphagus winogradskyi]SMP33446.1 hypothetical protein SAMN06265367_108193 [Algoriphagus winogradskyi]